MCGRYTLFTPQTALEERFGVKSERSFDPRYNCAPGQSLPVVTDADPDAFTFGTWGFTPSWADKRKSIINARAETVREKRSFREAFERRRCLVPADGFYEWVDGESGKRPYRVAFADDRPFAMAGIWERWTPPGTQTDLVDFADGGGGDGGSPADPETVETFAVVTTEPNDVVTDLHHRMAVILDPDEEETWLRGDPDAAAELLDPHPGEEMRAYPVSTRVNDPSNDDADLVAPVDG